MNEMPPKHPPSLSEFMSAPRATVAAVAPATMVLATGGTRRDALLNGIDFDGYFAWTMDQMLAAAQRIFDLGVRHLFVSIMRSTQFAEQGAYGERLWAMARQILGDEDRIARIAAAGIQVRTFGASDAPLLGDILTRVEEATANGTAGTLWWTFAPTPQSPWQHALRAIVEARALTPEAAIRAIYGTDIPPVGIYLAFGKPFLSAELIPPLLEGEAAAFWYQQPGYTPVTERLLRRVFYETAYMRRTWQTDKGARYGGVAAQRELWQRPLTLGLGRRVEHFWYPQLADDEGGSE